jgi:molybdate transport system substrate-binding protein
MGSSMKRAVCGRRRRWVVDRLRRRRALPAWLVVLPLLPLTFAACRGGDAADGSAPASNDTPILVFAAADLQAALPEIARQFEARTGWRADLVLGSTGNLTTQIEHGAPADLFLAANQAFLDRLAERELLRPDTRRTYARGRIVAVWADGARPVDSLPDLLLPAYATVAIANPEHAPYGVAAREALQRSGVWDAVRNRLVQGENVAQAYQFVRTGNADAGVVALGVVLGTPGVPHRLINESEHAPLLQGGAVLRASRNPSAAEAFLHHVLSPEGQAILRRYGFEPPEDR